jgi:hypothetical protein
VVGSVEWLRSGFLSTCVVNVCEWVRLMGWRVNGGVTGWLYG